MAAAVTNTVYTQVLKVRQEPEFVCLETLWIRCQQLVSPQIPSLHIVSCKQVTAPSVRKIKTNNIIRKEFFFCSDDDATTTNTQAVQDVI